MSDRVCARGCTQRGIHYATCADFGLEDAPAEEVTRERCGGCAPRPCRDGSLVCDRCFGRARHLLDDLPDLIARLRSVIDPSKATPTDKEPGGGQSSEPVAAVGSDPLDALIACETALGWWWRWGEDLQLMSNRTDALWLFDLLLDRNPEVDGIRDAWSVQDAVDRFGVERRPGKHEREWSPDPNSEEIASFPVREWGDALLNRDEAGELAGSARTLRRWVQKDLIAPVADISIAGVRTALFRASEIVRLKEEMSNA